jgi:protease-4
MSLEMTRIAILAILLLLHSAPLRGMSAEQGQPASETASVEEPLGEGDESSKPSDATKKAVVGTVTVRGAFPESAGQRGLFGELAPSLAAFSGRLDRAAKDKELQAVVLRIRSPQLGRGKLAEMRAAIDRIRRRGKRVVAQLESATGADYLLAAACDEIVMPESGMILIPGVRAEVTFYKGLFDKLGVHADILQVGDFKGAAEPYTRRAMSPEFRQQYQSLVDDFYDQMVETISNDRKLEVGRVKDLIDIGVFTPREALAQGLIDRVAYDDELESQLAKDLDGEEIRWLREFGKKKVDNDFSGMLGMMKLFEMMMGVDKSRRPSSSKKIAVIYASGMIMPGRSTASLFGVEVLGSDTIVKAIRQADQDKKVAAIILRVDSPGGSSLASDLVWRAIQECDKPTIASMGDTAASGGYYISMGCDRIFAEPGTLTGSIGVVGGKIAMKGLYDKVGLSTETISRGKNSGILAADQPFSDTERAAIRRTMEEVYRQFTRKAAMGRKMAIEQLEPLAGGRVWTGRQAQQNGLVDELGTLEDAIASAKELANIPDGDKVDIITLPRPTSFFDQLVEGNVQFPGAAVPLPDQLRGHVETAKTIRRMLVEPVLMLMPCQVEIR